MTTTRKPAQPQRDRSGRYRLPTGENLLSVTTILSNGIPKPALVNWAAREVAASAMDSLPRLVKASRDPAKRQEATRWLQNAANQKRDTAATLGSEVHHHIEAKILGQPAPTPSAECQPFLDQLEAFEHDFAPKWEASEVVVANRKDGWAGTLDWMAVIPAVGPLLVMGDTKTGKGVYPEAGLQMAAYRRAEVLFLKDGRELPMPDTHGAVVLHLRPDGYRLIPVESGPDAYETFLHARDIALWVKGGSDGAVGEPILPLASEDPPALSVMA
jgi:hypothetical protein